MQSGSFAMACVHLKSAACHKCCHLGTSLVLTNIFCPSLTSNDGSRSNLESRGITA
jgi:hypothetical protein